ncbi:MAG: thioredoxin family protein, partial [Lachnospiraceae bacterium]|nr:thioredoxin family protein [Lachnospiraceae bacterium]
GKLQEYENRKTYDIEHSELKRPVKSMVKLSDYDLEEVKVEVKEVDSVIYLFTTKTCPNCKIAKEYLKDVPYILIDAEENMEMARQYGVMQAPTLVVVKDGKTKKYVNASNINKFVNNLNTAKETSNAVQV